MRALTGLLILGAAFAAAPATASAQADTPMCPAAPLDKTLLDRLLPYLVTPGVPAGAPAIPTGGEAERAATEVLGGQLVFRWLDDARHGWSVAFTPGAHDAASARAGIRERLAAILTPAEVDYLDGTLTLLPTPYGRDELRAIEYELRLAYAAHNLTFAVVGCEWSDGYRVQVGVVDPDTPETRARIEALVAPYGDRVRVRYGIPRTIVDSAIGYAPAPLAQQQRPTLKVRDYVSLPRTKRCARTVGAKPRAGADVKRVRLAIGKRVSAGKNPRLKLKAKRSKVTVTVTLRDGTTAIETLTYRRCG